MPKPKKPTTKSSVVVGGAKKRKKNLLFGALAVLLLLGIGLVGYIYWHGQSLKAKAENWTAVAYNPSAGFNIRSCKAWTGNTYVVKFLVMRTLSSPNYSVFYGYSYQGYNEGGSGPWSAWNTGWGFYYQNHSVYIPGYMDYYVNVGWTHYGGSVASLNTC
jgi:hypothetical protein